MYQDPAHRRDSTIKLSFSDEELALLQAAANRRGMQLAEYCRLVAVDRATELLRTHNVTASS